MGIVTVFAILCGGWCSADLLSTPEYMVLGKTEEAKGEIWRCPFETPTACELFHKGSSIVTDTLVHGEHLYASHYNGVILKCNWYVEPQCEEFYRADAWVNSLAAAEGFLYAGTENGKIMRCQFNLTRSCSIVYTLESSVRSLYKYDNYIYAGTLSYLSKCSRGMQVNCYQLGEGSAGTLALSAWGDKIINYSWLGALFVLVRTPTSNKYTKINLNNSGYEYFKDMAIFKGNMYLVHSSGDIWTCQWDRDTPNNCTVFARHNNTRSISFVYRSHKQSVAPVERRAHTRSEPLVYNYDSEHRALLEVGVVDGKLHSARGAVDTRSADAGYSGRAAIFAMGPDGQLLVSAAHRSGLVHITSLFAGAPVAGAGEMHVEAGVVTRIVACSEQYRVTVDLNRQVVDELYSRGYTREIQLEECVYMNDRD